LFLAATNRRRETNKKIARMGQFYFDLVGLAVKRYTLIAIVYNDNMLGDMRNVDTSKSKPALKAGYSLRFY